MAIEKDRSFRLAERYVQETGASVFLTGKAGTGKTTFLKTVVADCMKRCAIVAPTGVAAINAGGVTIHSFFQLPLCPYLPDVKELITEYQMPEKSNTLRKERIKILRTLDLLIIDEISMVRADILDAIDMVLRRYRRNDRPFGGVQLLMIGDVQQLPPVVKDAERKYFDQVYPSPFFFNSKALQRLPFLTIELEKIHRQSDAEFMAILNSVRTGNPGKNVLARLNSRLDPSFDPPKDENWIRLTTHNSQADAVNAAKMSELPGKESVYDAAIDGNFPESAYPADTELHLKVGSQVMFIRNDASGEARYYNGKIGTVTSLVPQVIVTDEDGNAIEVERVEWQNVKYELDAETKEIVGNCDGVFSQYPLRLAWAITIHKSQGLTFDRVVIDAGSAFSFGQVYVALSRCRSLEGIVLSTPITPRCTFANEEVNSFENSYTSFDSAESSLGLFQQDYYVKTLCEAFDLHELRFLYNRLNRVYQVDLSNKYREEARAFKCIAEAPSAEVDEAMSAVRKLFDGQARKKKTDESSALEHMNEAVSDNDRAGIKPLVETADKFQNQIRRIVLTEADGYKSDLLDERVHKAASYFKEQLSLTAKEILPLLDIEIGDKAVKKTFKDASVALLKELAFKLQMMGMFSRNGFLMKAYQKVRLDLELSNEGTMKSAVKTVREMMV